MQHQHVHVLPTNLPIIVYCTSFNMNQPPPSGSAKSKYFKPGFIFKQANDETVVDNTDDLDADDLDELLSQVSTSSTKSISKTCEPSTSTKVTTIVDSNSLCNDETVEDRINSIESQSVDFTTTKPISDSVPSLKGSNNILVNPNQSQNPLLRCLRTVRYTLTDSIAPAHYLLFDSCCALFLSLKYHVIHPNYIYERISQLHNKYRLKILLLLMDHVIYEQSLKELTILAVRTNFTLMLAWSYEEAARHIENYRLNADKPPDLIMGRTESEPTTSSNKTKSNAHMQQNLIDALTTVKAVNRTDAVTLLSTFESFENLVKANTDELTICPGISMVKARRLQSVFNRPFIKNKENNV